MAKVVGSPDGYVLIDSKISTNGMAKGAADLKTQFAGMAKTASQAGTAIQNALSGSFSKSVEIAKARVLSLENQFAGISADLAAAISADDDSSAEKLAAKQVRIYDKLEEARERLRIEVEADAKKQADAEEKAAKKSEKAHTKANKESEKETKRSSKTMGRFGSRLSGIAMSAFLFNSLSAGFRNIAEYISNAITSTDGMKRALANLKGAAQQAAAPIIQAITPALTALANAAATAVSYVAQLFATFSGKSVSELGKSAKALNQNAKAAGKLSRSVAGFDQLTKLQDNSGGGGEIAPNYDFIAEPVDFLEMIKQQILNGDWYGAGEILATKINELFTTIDWLSIGKKIGEAVGGIFQFLIGAAANFDPFATLGSVNGIFGGLFQKLAEAIEKLNWQEIGGKLVKAIIFGVLMADPAAAIITILTSPNGDELMSGAMELMGSIIGALARAIVGMGKEIGRIATELWDSLKSYFDEYVDWEGTPGEIIAGLFQGIIDALKDVGDWIKENIFTPFIEGIRKAFDINSPSKVMEEEGGYIMEGLFNGLLGGLGRLGEIGAEIWTTIKDAFSDVSSWFETTFSDAWEAVLGIFSSDSLTFSEIKESMSTTFKEVVNKLSEGLNKVIRKPFESINGMLNKIRGWEIFGETPFSGLWSYNPISVPQIPYLAKGAVIPPNAPFMAVLGDQRHGTNIEAPLSTIQEALGVVMQDYIASNMAGHEATVGVLREILQAVLGIEIGDATIAEAVARYNRKLSVARGG